MADTFCLLRLSSGWLNDLADRHGVVWLSSSAAATGAGAQTRLATTRLAQTFSDQLIGTRPTRACGPIHAKHREQGLWRISANDEARGGVPKPLFAYFRTPCGPKLGRGLGSYDPRGSVDFPNLIGILRLCRVPTSPVVLGVFGGALTSLLVFCDFIHFLLTLSNLEPFMQR